MRENARETEAKSAREANCARHADWVRLTARVALAVMAAGHAPQLAIAQDDPPPPNMRAINRLQQRQAVLERAGSEVAGEPTSAPAQPIQSGRPAPTRLGNVKPGDEKPAEVDPNKPVVVRGNRGGVAGRKGEVEAARAGSQLTVTFKNAELTDVIQTISDRLKINFILPESLRKAKVTILSPEPVTDAELWEAFLSVLRVSKLTLVKTGAFYKIDNMRDTHSEPIPLLIGNDAPMGNDDQLVTWIFRLQHVDAQTILPTVKALSSKDGNVINYNPTNTLIVIDTGANIIKLRKILEQLDQPGGTDELYIIDIRYAPAQEIADKLTEVFNIQKQGTQAKAQKGRAAAPPPPDAGGASGGEEGEVSVSKVIADERTNKVILITDERSLQRVLSLVAKLDVPIPGDGQVHVYYLKNTSAEDVAQTLSQLTGGTGARPTKGRTASKAGGAAGPASASLFEGEVKVTADKSTNSLVIVASQADFRSLRKVIDALDIARLQIFVEAVVMEISLGRVRDIGLSAVGGVPVNIDGQQIPIFFGSSSPQLNAALLNPASLASLSGFLGGIRGPDVEGSEDTLGVGLPSFGALMNLLQTTSDANVLSTPHILTTDNEEAEIIVGENVPFQSGFTQGVGGAIGGFNPIVSIQRQDVALKLKVKPQISSGDSVRMILEQEISEVARTDPLLGPTTSKRSAKTVVAVRDQQSVVIGGLIRDRQVESATKVPFLGDIPVIGVLFRSTKTTNEKTNLLLVLTPYIIRQPADFRKIFERKMRERQEFVERFYGGVDNNRFTAYFDFDKSAGPLARIKETIGAEMERFENGGGGAKDQSVVQPRVQRVGDDAEGILRALDPAPASGTTGWQTTETGPGDDLPGAPARSSAGGEAGGDVTIEVTPEAGAGAVEGSGAEGGGEGGGDGGGGGGDGGGEAPAAPFDGGGGEGE